METIFTTVENYQLAKSGQVTKAIIIKKEWESSSYRNPDGFYYKFILNSIIYHGHTFDKDLTPNDSLAVVYLLSDPSVNRPLDFIKRNYRN